MSQEALVEARRVGDGHARGKILEVVCPVRVPFIGLAREIKCDWIVEGQASQLGLCPLVEPAIQAGCGRYLYSVHFVGRLQERPTEAVGDREVLAGPPGILHIGLKLMVEEMT